MLAHAKQKYVDIRIDIALKNGLHENEEQL